MKKITNKTITTNPIIKACITYTLNILICVILLIKLVFTLSEYFNRKIVEKHPLFFRIHDYFIIGCGFFGAILIFAGCCLIETSTTTSFIQLILEFLPFELAGFTIIGLIMLCNNNDIWYH